MMTEMIFYFWRKKVQLREEMLKTCVCLFSNLALFVIFV